MNVAQDSARRDRGLALGAFEEDVEERRDAEWPELRAAVRALPERQRTAIFLRHYADLEYEQIAATLGVARGTVAAGLHAAYQSLRKRMSEVPDD